MKGISINCLTPAAMLVLLGVALSLPSKQVVGADIAGYMEYKKKLEAQERALEGLQKVEDLAKKGDVESQYELAMAYRYGWGIGQNNRDAALWFREAVDSGHGRAQFELGLMYEFGEGVPKNLKRAHALYQQAAKQDIREARVSLALIRGKMLKVEEYIRNHHKPNYNTQQ